MTPEQKKEITNLRAQKLGYQKIADALGLTKNQVVSYCHRNGLDGKIGDPTAEASKIIFCRNCGKPIQQRPGVKTIKFCSGKCCQEWWNRHAGAVNRRQTAIYTFTCAHCGKIFTAYGNRHRKYCSHACYIADRFGGGSHE